MVCFPYTLLIGEFRKVPKKWDKSPVLSSCCLSPSHWPLQGAWSSSRQAPRQGSQCGWKHQPPTSRSHTAAIPGPGELVQWPFTVTSVDNTQQWGCTIKHYIHIKSNPSVPPCSALQPEMRSSCRTVKPARLISGLSGEY